MFMMSVYDCTNRFRTEIAAWNPICAFCMATIVCSSETVGLSICSSRCRPSAWFCWALTAF